MKKIFTLYLSLFCLHILVYPQASVEELLLDIETNNTQLKALRKQIEAEKLGNRTGIFIPNPEVGFNYLWGSPSTIGNRTDFSVSQSMDFPSTYTLKNKISRLKNNQLELEYQRQLRDLRMEVQLICLDVIYANALGSELRKRLVHAHTIAEAFQSQFEQGETNILEFNKAQLNLLNLSNKLNSNTIEQKVLLSNLSRLNGGQEVTISDSIFSISQLPADFQSWYQLAENKNPILIWLMEEIRIQEQTKKLNTAMSLPKLQAGYMSENVVGEKYQGLTVGLSIPLWENKNTVKFAEAQVDAMHQMAADKKLQFYKQLEILYHKAFELSQNTDEYRKQLALYNNADYLVKALDQGEISLIEFMLEFAIYYEGFISLLDMERELHITLVELNQYAY